MKLSMCSLFMRQIVYFQSKTVAAKFKKKLFSKDQNNILIVFRASFYNIQF
jgi:hypothetical protein